MDQESLALQQSVSRNRRKRPHASDAGSKDAFHNDAVSGSYDVDDEDKVRSSSYRRNFLSLDSIKNWCLWLYTKLQLPSTDDDQDSGRHRRRRLLYFGIISIPFILRPSRLWRWPRSLLGLDHPDQKLDNYFKTVAYFAYKEAERQRLTAIGIDDLPIMEVLDKRNQINMLDLNTRAAMRELLVRRQLRNQLWTALEHTAVSFCNNTTASNKKNQINNLLLEFNVASVACWSQTLNLCGLPKVMYVDDESERPRPGMLERLNVTLMVFNRVEIEGLLRSKRIEFNKIKSDRRFESVSSVPGVWPLAAVWAYGGIYVNRWENNNSGSHYAQKEEKALRFISRFRRETPTAVVELSSRDGGRIEIAFLAATPRHPILGCLISTSTGDIVDWLLRSKQVEYFEKTKSISCKPGASTTGCCELSEWSEESSSRELSTTAPTLHLSFIGQTTTRSRDNNFGTTNKPYSKVEIGSRGKVIQQTLKPKRYIEGRLRDSGALPGWICTRCLNAAIYGTVQKCLPFLCSVAYEKIVCHEEDAPKQELVVPVNVSLDTGSSHRIPRIIHQTWFEHLAIDRYPELIRLQNSWKNSGWEYRFYDDEAAKQYIQDNFPSPFADAFETLLPGAYKADFFRYLVLMKDGGVYADVDILLETNLTAFVTPTMSFFAPRDVVGEYAGTPFCLWNGFMGASAGHPFLVRAVERLLNLILDRADLFDIERDVCKQVDEVAELWKLRSQPVLMLSGPCALGIAANEAMGRSSLSPLGIGWIGLDRLERAGSTDHGDALILVGDKYDMGSFRISDPERNLVLVATNLDGVGKTSRYVSHSTPIDSVLPKVDKVKKRPHYSDSGRGVTVWGTENVYKDNLVSDIRVRFKTKYNAQ